MSNVSIFVVSALLHEVAVSAPLQVHRPFAFAGMLLQVVLVATTEHLFGRTARAKNPGARLFFMGNAALWLSVCVVGQPLSVVLYSAAFAHVHS